MPKHPRSPSKPRGKISNPKLKYTPIFTQILDVYVGERSIFLLLTNGELYAFGEGTYGELGCREPVFRQLVPTRLPGLWKGLKKLAAGPMHSLALMETGELYTWGAGRFGALPTGDRGCVMEPQPVALSHLDGKFDTPVFRPQSHTVLKEYQPGHRIGQSSTTIKQKNTPEP